VRHHEESTERQYALRQKAAEPGWSESSIRILDFVCLQKQAVPSP
jgi:hypothetical protein